MAEEEEEDAGGDEGEDLPNHRPSKWEKTDANV